MMDRCRVVRATPLHFVFGTLVISDMTRHPPTTLSTCSWTGEGAVFQPATSTSYAGAGLPTCARHIASIVRSFAQGSLHASGRTAPPSIHKPQRTDLLGYIVGLHFGHGQLIIWTQVVPSLFLPVPTHSLHPSCRHGRHRLSIRSLMPRMCSSCFCLSSSSYISCCVFIVSNSLSHSYRTPCPHCPSTHQRSIHRHHPHG